jgi:predicted SAM-dependent methyltransferase
MALPPTARRLLRGTIHALNRPLATLRCRLAARRAPRPVVLEVGGLTPRDGWFMVNVNAVTPHYMDGTKTWVFEDESLSYVYADNMIEHVPLSGGRRFLAEAHRCLRPGGVIRLVTPDVRHHVELYLQGVDVQHDELADEYRKLGVVLEHPIDILRTPIGEFGHHSGYVYDFDTLEDELVRAGFTNVRRWAIGESDDPMLKGLEQRPEHGPLQMVVEATR